MFSFYINSCDGESNKHSLTHFLPRESQPLPQDDLPDEVFAKIMNLVFIKQVIRCAIVSKRWDPAWRFIIRTRESLLIGYDNKKRQAKWIQDRLTSDHMDDVTLNGNQLVSEKMNSLNQMKDLKRMFVVTSDVSKAGSTGEQEAVEHAPAGVGPRLSGPLVCPK